MASSGLVAQLIPLNPAKLQVHDIRETDECITIGRNANCDLVLPDQRCSSNHCRLLITREGDKFVFEIEDLSTNGTYVNNSPLGKGNRLKIQHGDDIIFLHEKKVGLVDMLGFKLTFPQISLKRKLDDPVAPEKRVKLSPADHTDGISADLECGLCHSVIHQCFCGGCTTKWLETASTCPTCRNEVNSVKRNASVNSIIATYLAAHTEKARPASELADLERMNKITNDSFTVTKKKQQQKKRFESDGSASSGNDTPKAAKPAKQFWQGAAQCRQCKAEKDGYRCELRQEHIVCSACNTKIPKRADVHQQCQICEKFFCNLTYRALKHCETGVEALNTQMAKWTTIPPSALSENVYEQNVLKDFLRTKGITAQQFYVDAMAALVAEDWALEVNTHRTKPRPDWFICKECIGPLLTELLFKYRESISEQFPAHVKARPKCWYGRECTTQKHNTQHAAKYSHICPNAKRK